MSDSETGDSRTQYRELSRDELCELCDDCASVLDELDHGGGRVGNLAERLCWEPHRVTCALEQLKRDGCVHHNAASAVWSLPRALAVDLERSDSRLNFLDDVADELERARDGHPPINSAHEGYAVILEELDEFWEEVKRKRSQRDPEAMWAELVQVAAMAARTAEDVLVWSWDRH